MDSIVRALAAENDLFNIWLYTVQNDQDAAKRVIFTQTAIMFYKKRAHHEPMRAFLIKKGGTFISFQPLQKKQTPIG